MLIDGNDARGIDVGLISRFPIEEVRSHIDDRRGRKEVFSRDCPEMRVSLGEDLDLWVLLNHLKSKASGTARASGARRKGQAEAIVAILERFDLRKDLVIVAGDLNDTPGSGPLAPLLGVPDLYDVLDIVAADDRWTYHYGGRKQQIDYVLVSKPLRAALADTGVFRGGMFDVEKHTTTGEKRMESVTSRANRASDHGCVWADFAW